ncbi:type II toxin-antitoxin system VapB family antitoxin [Cardiobacterium sp. AH-315-I02]|nr:type II toxin-antitoxin system VapB family antitoxin [Cardiobacterium sp. AH-315-I02]
MRTSLNIDDTMLFEIMQVTGKDNRSEAIRIALAAFLKQQKKNKILALRGKVDIKDNWQSLRELEKAK